jgi:small basic protein
VILLPILALIVGALLAILLKVDGMPGLAGQYLAVACLAGFDSVCGGVRGGLEGKFSHTVFITGFFSNALIASLLAWLGDQTGINLFLAVALVLGMRVFTNLSLIRRFLVTRWEDAREKARLQAAAAQVAGSGATEGANA